MSEYSRNVAKGSFTLAIAFAIAFALGLLGQGSAYAAVGSLSVGTMDTVTTIAAYGDDAINTTGKANVQYVYKFGWVGGKTNADTSATAKKFDVTGDGYADTIKIKATQASSKKKGLLKKVKITVNGATAKTFTNTSNYIDRVLVSVVTLKNKAPFLWVDILDAKGNATQGLYQYDEDDESFVRVISNKDIAKAKTSNQYISYLAPSGNNVNVTYRLSTTVTGITKAQYTYAYEDGELERTSNTSTKISYATYASGTHTKKKLTSAGSFKVYTSTALKKVKFTVPANKQVQPVAVRISGSKLLYKVTYKGKTGWIQCPKIKKRTSKSPSTLFYETYGKVTLKASTPSYSFNTYYKASDLQKYNNHALFVARNEIYARHGRTFASAELQTLFNKKSWYNTNRKYGLNKIERANVALIYGIEQSRGSLYVS